RWGDLLASLGDRRKAFRALDVPVLAMVGSDDTLAPLAYTHEIVEWARTALLVQVSHAGHLAPLENPREVAQVLAGFTARFRDLGGTNAEWFDALEDDEEDDPETDPVRHLPFDN
ncbi:MAG TPA: alpha/beta hydrolase, partial [Deinococcales bacterium]|nr:alpha/beta hydrolase [Deinococcales bacterium]